MTLNASGPISLAGTTAGQSIEIELGGTGTTQISLNCTSVRTLAGVPSGAITMPTNFYGKANQFTYTISTNQTNLCMRAAAISAGWGGSSKLIVNINSGVVISSNGTGTPAMTISGSYPGTVTVTNNGTIAGMGGAGGKGACLYSSYCPGSPGSGGGTALKVSSAVTFINTSGVIAGGGGGGGGGGGQFGCCVIGGGGGGGGRSSNFNSSGGAGGGGPSGSGSGGGAGTFSAAGTGGSGPGNGGNGGGWGSSGANGTAYMTGGGSGGGGGKATCGAVNITWSGTGTRYGSIS